NDPSDSRFVYANAGCARTFGYAPDEIVGQPVTMFDGPATDRTAFYEEVAEVDPGTPVTAELIVYKKDGPPLTIELPVLPTRIHTGEGFVLIGVGRDVT